MGRFFLASCRNYVLSIRPAAGSETGNSLWGIRIISDYFCRNRSFLAGK